MLILALIFTRVSYSSACAYNFLLLCILSKGKKSNTNEKRVRFFSRTTLFCVFDREKEREEERGGDV
jgi:hypothetical protein